MWDRVGMWNRCEIDPQVTQITQNKHGKNKSFLLKVKNSHLTGVKKNMAGCDSTVNLVKIWVSPMKFCEADPCRDFSGVETKNYGPLPRYPVKYLPG